MTQTLEYRLEQNQAKQRKLNKDAFQQLDRAYYKALRWIEKREPELAGSLHGRKDHNLVFTELCLVYGDKLWKPSENEMVLWPKYSLTKYLSKKDKGSKDSCNGWMCLRYIVRACQFLLLAIPLSRFLAGLSPFLSELACIYLGSVLVRIILKRVHIRYNLTWYAPIYRLYDFQRKNREEIAWLKMEEHKLRKYCELVSKSLQGKNTLTDLEVFPDHGKEWFELALSLGSSKKNNA